MPKRRAVVLAMGVLGLAAASARDASAKAICAVVHDDATDGGVHEIECDGGVGEGGVELPPPPWTPPPIPDPEPDPECACDLKDSTEKTGPFKIPQIGQNFPAEKLFGPGQSIGFFLNGSYEKTTSKSPCACYEKTDSSTTLAGSIQV